MIETIIKDDLYRFTEQHMMLTEGNTAMIKFSSGYRNNR